MANYDANIVSRIMDALTWEMTNSDVLEGVLDHFGPEEVLEQIGKKAIIEYLGEEEQPQDIFTEEELEEWARDNDFVSAAEMDNYDPPGYEERERY